MRRITIGNIERFTDFSRGIPAGNDWIEPVYIAALKTQIENSDSPYQATDGYLGAMLNGSYKPNRSYTPIEPISSRGEIERTARHMTDTMMQNFSNLDETDARDLQHHLNYLFSELMNNVIDHSHSPVGGYAMAQYYPTKRKIQFAIADAGIGFLPNVQIKEPKIDNEYDAIRKAIEKGFTATRATLYGQERNAGFGLFAMKEILDETGGTFVIASNDALLRYQGGEYSRHTLRAPYRGAFVAFEFFEANINLELGQILGRLREESDAEEEFY